MVAVVDYGVGNMFSIRSSLRFLAVDCEVTADPARLAAADRVILPGVGAFEDAAAKLRAQGLDRVLIELAQGGKPLLGICLGMQLLFEESEEYGRHQGLGLLKGAVKPLTDVLDPGEYPVPHIGWNPLERTADCPLLEGVSAGAAMYYVHSFYVPVGGQTTAYSTYGPAKVSGIVQRGKLFGCQFHPEKSGAEGLKILHAFCNLTE